MFTREVRGTAPAGGLKHLDKLLGGCLTRFRRGGYFAGHEGETLLISRPPAGIQSKEILVIGLGDPGDWSPSTMKRAAATAARCAIQQRVRSVAFAPSMLDSGLTPTMTADVALKMLSGVIAAIDVHAKLVELDLALDTRPARWVFDAGSERFENAADQFQSILMSYPHVAGSSVRQP
jgi:hypothetical protein